MVYVDIGCRLALGVIFVVSAWSKLKGRMEFAAFTREVRRMGAPPRLSGMTARAVAIGEVAVPVLLAIPWWPATLSGYFATTALLTAFTAGIVASLRRGDRAPCNCFGRSTVPLGRRHVIRNLGLIAVALLGAGAVLSRAGVAPDPGLAIVAGLVGLVVGGLVAVADDLTAVLSPGSTRRPSRKDSP